jgi:hypothetical protein
MESIAKRTFWKSECNSYPLHELDARGFFRSTLACVACGIQRDEGNCLELAKYRWCFGESTFGSSGGWSQPDRQGKKESNRHLLTDGRGVPLSIVVTGATRHDVTQLEVALDEIIIERPKNIDQHLCTDKGYSGEPARKAMKDRCYIPHVKKRG